MFIYVQCMTVRFYTPSFLWPHWPAGRLCGLRQGYCTGIPIWCSYSAESFSADHIVEWTTYITLKYTNDVTTLLQSPIGMAIRNTGVYMCKRKHLFALTSSWHSSWKSTLPALLSKISKYTINVNFDLKFVLLINKVSNGLKVSGIYERQHLDMTTDMLRRTAAIPLCVGCNSHCSIPIHPGRQMLTADIRCVNDSTMSS